MDVVARSDRPNAKSGPSDSPPPSRSSNVGPNYDFYGLAATETQTEISKDGFEVVEKSQKENVDHSNPDRDAEVLRMETMATRKRRTQTRPFTHKTCEYLDLKANGISAKAVSFQSPRRGNMANATHKALPDSSLNSPPIRPGFRTHNSSYSKYRRSPGSPNYSSSHERVLVAATPSASGSSQSRPRGDKQFGIATDYQRLSVERSTLDEHVNEPMDHSSPSSAMSYSYLRSSSPPAFPKFIMPTPYSTSTSECGTTQPASQETQLSTQILEDEPETSLPDNEPISYHTAASTNAPRSLLSSLSPSKQLRYVKHLKVPPNDMRGAVESNLAGTVDQTQPSFEDEELARYRARRAGFPPRRPPSRSRSPQNDYEAIPGTDAMDVDHGRLSKFQAKVAPEPNRGDPVLVPMVVDSRHDTAVTTHLNRSEDEDDLPLATMSRLRRKNMKLVSQAGKVEPAGSTTAMRAIPPAPKQRQEIPLVTKPTAPTPSSPSKSKPKANVVELGRQLFLLTKTMIVPNIKRLQQPGKFQDMVEIPSSVPDQDGKAVRAQEPARNRGRPRKPSSGVVKKPSVSAGARAREPRFLQGSPLTDSGDDELLVPLREENEQTDIVDEEYSEPEPRDEGGSSRKRKRSNAKVTKATTKRLRSKTPASNNKVAASSGLKTTSGPRRLRSAAPSGPEYQNLEATRVFALWKQDNHYYSGVVHQGVVTVNHMRRYELIVGDHVLIPGRTRSNKVVNVSKFDSEDIISINLDEDIEEVQVASIKIAAKTVMSAWKERMLSQDSIIPTLKSNKSSPSPSKRSVTGSINRSSSHGLFSGTGLVITLSPDVVDREKKQRNLVNLIKKNGGTVLDDWGNVISMDGAYSQSDHRWTIEVSDAKWIGGEHIERIFVLADQQNSKPKYLIALGFGIPCLSLSWIHDSIEAGQEKDWHSYMLPQGLSEYFGTILTQQVDSHWGNSTHYLTGIMTHRTPSRVFFDKRILCVGSQMTPRPNKNSAKAGERFQEPSIAMLRIIFSMGAKRVEAVSDIKYSRCPHDLAASYDYVVVGDDYQGAAFLAHPRVAPWAWVKKCLLATRIVAIDPEQQSPQQSQTQGSPVCFDEEEEV
ncbi:hypothetical protein BD779DRAFT_1509432 [Infundibulicybe gibba]|nr:hypothetical protein BD779DRAFT_1509432 [Infundibulicybe gibba]